MPTRLLLHAPCAEGHFQPVRGFLRPWFKSSITLHSTRPSNTHCPSSPLASAGKVTAREWDWFYCSKRTLAPLLWAVSLWRPEQLSWLQLDQAHARCSPAHGRGLFLPLKGTNEEKKKVPKQPEQRGPSPLPTLWRAPQKGTTWLRPCLQLVLQGCSWM